MKQKRRLTISIAKKLYELQDVNYQGSLKEGPPFEGNSIKALRDFCLECSNGEDNKYAGRMNCQIAYCAFYPFRNGYSITDEDMKRFNEEFPKDEKTHSPIKLRYQNVEWIKPVKRTISEKHKKALWKR